MTIKPEIISLQPKHIKFRGRIKRRRRRKEMKEEGGVRFQRGERRKVKKEERKGEGWLEEGKER